MSRSNDNHEHKSALPDSHQEDELRNLFESARLGSDPAQTRLLEDHSGLIRSMIASYKSRLPPFFDEETLEAEAQSALLRAIREVDLERLDKFVPYAKQVIRNDFNNLVRQHASNTRQQYDNNREYENMYLELTNNNRTQPEQEEVYAELGWGNTKIRNHRQTRIGRSFSLEQLRESVDSEDSSLSNTYQRLIDYSSKNGQGCEVWLWRKSREA